MIRGRNFYHIGLSAFALALLLLVSASQLVGTSSAAPPSQALDMCMLAAPGATSIQYISRGCSAKYGTGKFTGVGSRTEIQATADVYVDVSTAAAQNMINCALSPDASTCTPNNIGDKGYELITSRGNTSASPVSLWYGRSARSCYYAEVFLQAYTAREDVIDQDLVQRGREIQKQIDEKLKNAPPCPGVPTAEPGRFNVRIDGNYDKANERIALSATVEPNSNADYYEWTLDGTLIQQGRALDSIEFGTASLPEDEHEIVVKVTDMLDNVSSSAAYNFTISRTPINGQPPKPATDAQNPIATLGGTQTANPAVTTPNTVEARNADLDLAAAENGGRVISVTDEMDKYPASNLIDGYKLDYGEWWTHEPPTFPQVIVFGLANDQVWTIDRVVLNPWTSDWRYSWIQDFEIYVSTTSTDLDQMKQVGAFTLEHLGVDQTFTFDPVATRYVALVIRSSYGGAEGITLNEFEVYAAPADENVQVNPNNLVAAANGGSIVDFSSQDPNGKWSPENLIDSDETSPGWSSDEKADGQQYVVFGLRGDKPQTVNRVVLNPYSEKYKEDWIQDFELRGALTYSTLDEMKSLGQFHLKQVGEDQEFTFPTTKLRYIALVPLANYGGSAYALNEFQVFAAPTEGTLPVEASAVSTPVPTNGNGDDTNTEWPAETHGTPANFDTHTIANTVANNIAVDVAANDLLPYVYHLYGMYFDSLVTTTLTNTNTFTIPVRVEATLLNYTETDVQTYALAPGESLTVNLDPPLLPGVFEQLHEAKPASLHVQIDYLEAGERRLIYEGTSDVTVWAQGDEGLGIPGYHDSFIFTAAMVTPNDPSLDSLMREAADYVPGGTITWGYDDDTDSNGAVYHKLEAVYDAIAARGVIYVATGIPFVPEAKQDEGFYLQRLKLPYQVLDTRSGMCIELSLLFASAYEKMLLDPVIIRIPGHAYVAVPIAEGSSTYYVVETTLVGRASFNRAIQMGSDEFNEALPEISKDRLDSYYWLNISDLRREGITPIPWR